MIFDIIKRVPIIYLYDIIFLILFSLAVGIFLWKKRKNLKREGPMYLYRTKIGIKFIDYVGLKYKKTLRFISFLAVITGYFLMIIMIYLWGTLVYIYVFKKEFVQAIKIPPVMPLVPYVPELFKINFLPPFYFTYWIIAIAVLALFHEFAHGIIARRYGVKIKATGFGFLGPFLAAFVDPDEKQMIKKTKFQQISILSAGTFTNLVLTFIFFFLLLGFFLISYSPAGAIFDMYTPAIVNISSIQKIDGLDAKNLDSKGLLDTINKNDIKNNYINEQGDLMNLTKIEINNKSYFIDINSLKKELPKNPSIIQVSEDYPAVKVGMKGTIIAIDNNEVKTFDQFKEIMKKYSPGDKIKIKTMFNKEILEYNIVLAEDPTQKGKAIIGVIYISEIPKKGVFRKVFSLFNFFRLPGTNYEANLLPELTKFIYDLLWWLALINLSVALMNMLPFTIFDGGRFFYLTVWGLTKSEKFAQITFKIVTYILLGSIFLLMAGWFSAVF